MEKLTNYHIHLMRHCIGMDFGQKKPYKRHGKLFFKPHRNYFCIGFRCDGYKEWCDIKEAGLAIDKFRNSDPEGATFHLNSKGMEWLGNRLGVTIYTDMANPFDINRESCEN